MCCCSHTHPRTILIRITEVQYIRFVLAVLGWVIMLGLRLQINIVCSCSHIANAKCLEYWNEYKVATCDLIQLHFTDLSMVTVFVSYCSWLDHSMAEIEWMNTWMKRQNVFFLESNHSQPRLRWCNCTIINRRESKLILHDLCHVMPCSVIALQCGLQ